MPRCARISVKESDVATDTNNKPLTRSVLKRKASEQLPTPQKRFCRSKNTSVRHETVPSRLKSKNCSDFRQKLPGTTGSKSAKEKNKDHDEIAAKLSTHSVVAVQDRDLRIEGDHGSENLVHPTMEALELDPMFENDENAPASRSELRNQRNLHGFRQPTLPIFELSASSEEIASYRALVSTDERQQLLHIDSTDYVARKPVIRLRVACCSALCPGLTGDTQVQSPRKPLGDVSSLVRTSEQEKSIGSNCVHAFADENKASSSSFSSGRVTRSSRRIAAAVRNGEVIQTASSRSKQQQVRANNGLENIFVHMDTSRVPDELPCREHEFEVICDFIANCSGKIAVSRTIYVSGVPGTGKTACVMQAIKFMKSMKKPPGPFKVITVNAMELIDPKFIFVEIHKQLFDQKIISPQCARRKLNNLLQFADRKREPIILIIDELDLLCTKQQEFIYDIYNWCVSDECRINVIAISNTLDLPERLFAKRVSSRMGANRLCFQPYDHNEIVRILLNRLEGLDVVQKEAVELASRKVAAVSGDLRKALDILRRSAQIAIDEGQNKLLMKNVQTAIAEASDTVTNQLIYSLSFHALLLLRSAYAERLSSGLDEFRFSDIVKHYRLISVMNNGQPLPTSSVYRLIMQLCSCRLLVAAPGSESWNRRLRLGLSAHDLQFALKQLDQNYEIVVR